MSVNVEVRTPKGRVDMVIRTLTTLYVVELKLNKTADIALEQINLRNYPERFALCGLPIVKVGINFDSERHTLGGIGLLNKELEGTFCEMYRAMK